MGRLNELLDYVNTVADNLKGHTDRDDFFSDDDMEFHEEGTVFLNVYDLNDKSNALNKALKSFESGVYHAAVEVYRVEYGYGGGNRGTGVFDQEPRQHDYHVYQRSYKLGVTKVTEHELEPILADLKKKWRAKDYHLTNHNCISFCMDFTERLGFDNNCYPKYISSAMRLGQKGLQIGNRIKEHHERIVKESKDRRTRGTHEAVVENVRREYGLDRVEYQKRDFRNDHKHSDENDAHPWLI